MTDAIAPTGLLDVRIWRHGRLIEHSRTDNLIVAASKYAHAHLIGGDVTGNSVSQIGFGSNALAATATNTALSVDAWIKGIDTITYPAQNQVAFTISLGAVEANGLVLAEYGLLTNSGALYARRVRGAPLIKDASIQITATWTVSY